MPLLAPSTSVLARFGRRLDDRRRRFAAATSAPAGAVDFDDRQRSFKDGFPLAAGSWGVVYLPNGRQVETGQNHVSLRMTHHIVDIFSVN